MSVEIVRVDLRLVREDGGYQSKRAELPIDKGTLAIVASGLLAGYPFTERVWAGRGRPLSCNQVRTLRRVFRQLGVLEPVNPCAYRQGDKLTRAGRAFMQHFAGAVPFPTNKP